MAITISKWMGKRDLFANRIQMMERESLLSRILYDRNSCRKIPTFCSSRCLSARHLQVAPAPPYSTLRKQLGDGQQKNHLHQHGDEPKSAAKLGSSQHGTTRQGREGENPPFFHELEHD